MTLHFVNPDGAAIDSLAWYAIYSSAARCPRPERVVGKGNLFAEVSWLGIITDRDPGAWCVRLFRRRAAGDLHLGIRWARDRADAMMLARDMLEELAQDVA